MKRASSCWTDGGKWCGHLERKVWNRQDGDEVADLRGPRREYRSGARCAGLEILLKGDNNIMNWEQIEGHWKQFRGSMRQRWGKLTDSDFEVISGKKDALVGKIQEKYGIAKENAERQVETWQESVMKV